MSTFRSWRYPAIIKNLKIGWYICCSRWSTVVEKGTKYFIHKSSQTGNSIGLTVLTYFSWIPDLTQLCSLSQNQQFHRWTCHSLHFRVVSYIWFLAPMFSSLCFIWIRCSDRMIFLCFYYLVLVRLAGLVLAESKKKSSAWSIKIVLLSFLKPGIIPKAASLQKI